MSGPSLASTEILPSVLRMGAPEVSVGFLRRFLIEAVVVLFTELNATAPVPAPPRAVPASAVESATAAPRAITQILDATVVALTRMSPPATTLIPSIYALLVLVISLSAQEIPNAPPTGCAKVLVTLKPPVNASIDD